MADDAPAATSPEVTNDEKKSTDEMALDNKSSDAGKATASDGDTAGDKKDADDTADKANADQSGGDDDVAMTDDHAGEEDAGKANGTSSTSEKKSDKPRRKSTGVPEHKSKKLKAKKSKGDLHLDAKAGELYLARMKGHPAWPSIIADDDMLPEAISKSRPVTAPNSDGTWRRADYAPGGKRHGERTFPIMFLHTNEFAWIPNTDLTTISVDECKDVPEKNKSKTLLEAYREAAKGHTIEHYKSVLNDHANAIIEEEQARADREAEKARKADKKAKRKSEAAAAEDDEMDVDEGGDSKPKSKKRKKEAEADDNEKVRERPDCSIAGCTDINKPAKAPKTTKLKLSTPKTPATTEKSSKKKEASAKSSKKKSAAKANGSDDDADTPAEDSKTLTPEERHTKLKEEIRFCRHKLQRTLLSPRETVPSDEEVKACEPYLTRLENYPDLPADIIAATKIHKVLKNIIKLPPIPKDEQYSFKKRSGELLTKWNKILAENPQPAEKKEDGEKKEGGANGEAKADGSAKASVEDDKATPAADGKESPEKKEDSADDEEKKDEKPSEKAEEKTAVSETKAAPAEDENTKPAEAIEATA